MKATGPGIKGEGQAAQKVTDPDVLDFVDELIRAGGKPKKILKYLKETTGNVEGCSLLHRFFEVFPEVAMLDSTHGTNSSLYQLFSFMIGDGFGHLA
ncbi:hypothetical protein GQ600_24230 [Phytophthora cactorum]|nr:hypothetical protein GQ600_24230 [Phytophthora cactorum]